MCLASPKAECRGLDDVMRAIYIFFGGRGAFSFLSPCLTLPCVLTTFSLFPHFPPLLFYVCVCMSMYKWGFLLLLLFEYLNTSLNLDFVESLNSIS